MHMLMQNHDALHHKPAINHSLFLCICLLLGDTARMPVCHWRLFSLSNIMAQAMYTAHQAHQACCLVQTWRTITMSATEVALLAPGS